MTTSDKPPAGPSVSPPPDDRQQQGAATRVAPDAGAPLTELRCECGGNDLTADRFIAVHEWGYHMRERCAPWSEGDRRALRTLHRRGVLIEAQKAVAAALRAWGDTTRDERAVDAVVQDALYALAQEQPTAGPPDPSPAAAQEGRKDLGAAPPGAGSEVFPKHGPPPSPDGLRRRDELLAKIVSPPPSLPASPAQEGLKASPAAPRSPYSDLTQAELEQAWPDWREDGADPITIRVGALRSMIAEIWRWRLAGIVIPSELPTSPPVASEQPPARPPDSHAAGAPSPGWVQLGSRLLNYQGRALIAESRAKELEGALRDCVAIVDKAGLLNLANGVQLGPTVWYVKAFEAFDYARRALAGTGAPTQETNQRAAILGTSNREER